MTHKFEQKQALHDFGAMYAELDEITTEAAAQGVERVWLPLDTLEGWTSLALTAYGLVNELMAGGHDGQA